VISFLGFGLEQIQPKNAHQSTETGFRPQAQLC